MKYIEKVSWRDVKAEVKSLNQDLHNAIELSNFDDGTPIYSIKYPYGFEALVDGQLFIPDDRGNPVPFHEYSREVSDDLAYAVSLPLGIVAEKKLELFLNSQGRTYPTVIFSKGDIFATSMVAKQSFYNHKRNFWQATAGVRTTFKRHWANYKSTRKLF